MKRVVLVRHAKAVKSDGVSISDFDRTLLPVGEADAALMAQAHVKKFGSPGRIVTSPAARTLGTAHYFAKESGIEPSQIVHEKAVYNASLEHLLDILRDFPATVESAMLVGHNPGMSLLATYLGGQHLEMSTASVAVLDLEIDHWEKVSGKCGRLLSFEVAPRHKRA